MSRLIYIADKRRITSDIRQIISVVLLIVYRRSDSVFEVLASITSIDTIIHFKVVDVVTLISDFNLCFLR